MNQWPGVNLVVTEGWDEEGYHTPDSLHYEGRAVDLTTSDKDRSKYGMLARLAVEAGFDWVYYESRAHIHGSVKSESSQAAKYGGCFSADSTILTSDGIVKKMSELKIGERILSQNPSTLELTFSEVLLFLHYNPEERQQFLKITLKSSRTLFVTPKHLVIMNSSVESAVFAEDLRVGDKLISNSKNRLEEDVIVNIDQIFLKGVYAPLTTSGTMVVNNILVSCYATVNSQSIAHWAYGPLRLIFNMKDSVHILWLLISRPLTESQSDVRTISEPSVGIHWYGRMLFVFAQFFVPTILH
ncbi:hypothetical protein WA026_016530 [Henosepilachna vigintioctopunctata]|uniref:Protein hedgehog n=1 Tax=Henosepilachna vigintioctopunctata TaxID=420089 RepID=A0AAW1VDV1_9CUCU